MTASKVEWGDWQTPNHFALKCCNLIRDVINFTPERILEPTCGLGNFIAAARETFPDSTITGIEVNHAYVEKAHMRFGEDLNVTIRQGDFLNDDIDNSVVGNKSLVVGNPPWVTNSALSSMGSMNLPRKTNFKGLQGIDAMTGSSNFDICECIILRALRMLPSDGVLAMLCKTTVARNICMELARQKINAKLIMYRFDAKAVFNVSVSACLFVCDLGAGSYSVWESDIDDPSTMSELSFDGHILHAKMSNHLEHLKGSCEMAWRQGVKHDCAKVMVLKREGDRLINGLGEDVEVEADHIFPFVKSSKSRQPIIQDTEIRVIMTQHRIGEDTSALEYTSPKLWSYLIEHASYLDGRKSSIYRNAPRFAMFGVGDYSYAPYKVGVSGFYKDPVFSLTSADRAVMYDDTCYFLAFNDRHAALAAMLLLNSSLAKDFYRSTAFLDSKRPYTKKVLAQLDMAAALRELGLSGLNATAERLGIKERAHEDDIDALAALVHPQQDTLRLINW